MLLKSKKEEIVKDLEKTAKATKLVRDNLVEYEQKDGRKIYLIGEGRLMNLAAAEGHPSAVMDLSFADQALMCEWLVKNHKNLDNKVHNVPSEIDEKVSRLKLQAMGVKIDILSPAQSKYLASWQEGT
jgi:adenosylhomocysteinase